VGWKDADRLPGLDQQRLVLIQTLQHFDDLVEALPVAGWWADAAIDDELIRLLGNVRIEVVHQAPQRGFLVPTFAT
jgi:hypothetical protein